jgi:hypothetical protein
VKTKISQPTHAKRSQPAAFIEPSDASIRACAYGLYEKSNRGDGHDVDHWVEATAILKAQAVGSQTSSSR